MNKAEIIEKLSQETNLSKTDVTKVITSFFDTIKETLKNKQSVKLIGFWNFYS